MNTIEEAARRIEQLQSSGVDTPSDPATAPATPTREVDTREHEVAAPRPEGLSGVLAQWNGERTATSQRSYAALTSPTIPAAEESPQAVAHRQPLIQRMSSERRRMASSLLLSLLIHGLLLSLTFGGKGLGLPGLRFPWQERRIEVPELRVVLVPTHVTAAEPAVTSVAPPLQQASIKPPAAGKRAPTPLASPAPLRRRALEIAAAPKQERNAVAPAVPAKASTRPSESRHAVPVKIPKTATIAGAPSDRPKLVVPTAPTGPDVITAAPSASSPETVMPARRDPGDLTRERIAQDVRQRAAALAEQADQLESARVEAAKRDADLRAEAARVEAAQVEAKREEAAQLAAARMEAERQEAARQEVAARLEAARRDAAQLEAERLLATRQEAARVEAARAAQLEAERQETVRHEAAARIEATRRAAAQLEAERRPAIRPEAAPVAAARTAQPEAQRQEPARQETPRAEAARPEAERPAPARQAAAPQDVARGEAEKEEDAKREERRRAIGRQLDEEAAQREARQLPLSLSTARRARLWGRADPNVELVQYAEGWARKIQFNTLVETVRELAKQPHRHPTVTVAIRSDGSVESVTFVVSSGVTQVDDAIRRIVKSHEHYPAFPPALAREYDVIEIRRTWHFDDAVRLQ